VPLRARRFTGELRPVSGVTVFHVAIALPHGDHHLVVRSEVPSSGLGLVGRPRWVRCASLVWPRELANQYTHIFGGGHGHLMVSAADTVPGSNSAYLAMIIVAAPSLPRSSSIGTIPEPEG
jgi:hypothetical protein